MSAFALPEILPEDIEFDKEADLIGKGSYGAVYRGNCRGYEVAVKIPKEQNLPAKTLADFQHEVKIMSMNAHPNVVRLMGACTIPGSLQIVTERCHGDVETLLYDESYKGTLYDRLKMVRDTANGMNWLHELTNTIHGDLKPANLLIDIDGHVKIADFGFGQLKQEVVHDAVVKGSVIWMAPEKLQNQQIKITEKVDVYSFGIILYELVTKKKPYQSENYHDLHAFRVAVCLKHERPSLTEEIPESLRTLITECWHTDPQQRPSFKEIITRLNLILVDCVLTTPSAATFWKKIVSSGQVPEYIDWPKLIRLLRQTIGPISDAEIHELQTLLVEKMKFAGKDFYGVTMARFNQVEKWFGPFYEPDEGPRIIQQLNQLAEQPWFHGEINQKNAESILAGHPEKTFLIRLSSTDPDFPFTLSMPKGHFKLKRSQARGITLQGLGFLAFTDHHAMSHTTAPFTQSTPCSNIANLRELFIDVCFRYILSILRSLCGSQQANFRRPLSQGSRP
eukprot:Phypoly_transcript_06676.p1 GENE.Phypoly_transcript_06676~~Phypoly_transcript_06676.p1  ORF type:complete len:507 (+),score=33.77 Phypoly_transcript_06676:125-1645(+)